MMNNKELIEFFSFLSIFLNSNISLKETLDIYLLKNKNNMIINLRKDVINGKNLVYAFSKITNNSEILMYIKLIEITGDFKTIFNIICENLKIKEKIKNDLKLSMIYPVILLTVSIVVISILFIFVVPKFILVYEDMNIELPIITKIMISISNMFILKIIIFLITIFLILIFIKMLKRKHKYNFDKFFLKSRFFKIMYNYTILNFSLSMMYLLNSKISLENSINILCNLENEYLRFELNDIKNKINKGVDIYTAFNREIFEYDFLNLIYIGSKTNTLENSFKLIYEFYFKKFNDQIKIMIKYIEPFIIIFISIFIFLIMLSIVIPIITLPNFL